MDIAELKNWFSNHRETLLDDYFTFLRFKSIATDPAFDQETKDCANWLESYLNEMGLEVQQLPTSGQPVVFAEKKAQDTNRPTLCIYQHYDVQPVDPIELWDSPPFEPVERDGQVFARGAQDNKGQCFYTLAAIKACLELVKQWNFNLKLFIDGEEESGSHGTQEVLESHKELLKSDYLLIVDSGLPTKTTPAITIGSRGIVSFEVKIRTAKGDMHSGRMGGIAYNPNKLLMQLLSSLFDEEGRVVVPGFYDGIETLTQEEKDQLDLSLDERFLHEEMGLKAFCPEPGFSIEESAVLRPTLEINGISGGYAGEGFKTVLPAVANAKISCRLVPNQDPQEIFSSIAKHLKERVPQGVEVEVILEGAAEAFRSSPDSPIAKMSAQAYESVLGKPCQKILIGGSIPISVDLAKATGAETVLIGYALDSDQIHAPNEHFGLDRLEQGFLTISQLFGQLNE